MPSPIIPSNLKNPVNTGQISRKAIGRIRRGAKLVRQRVMSIYNSVPRERIDAASGIRVNSPLPDDHPLHANQEIIYRYALSADVLTQIRAEIEAILRVAYMGTELPNPLSDWYMYTAVDSSYEQGAAEAVTNLGTISEDYDRSVLQVVTSRAYVDRIALVRSRVFEEMEGLTDSTRSDLATTLARGMESGMGPREIAKNIKHRVKVSQGRADRIARTEIGQAHRRARSAEAKDARDRVGLRVGMLRLSALSPTTRPDHAAEMGTIRSPEENELWYAEGSRAINCKCGDTEILLDEDGNPTDTKLIERLKERRDKFVASTQ